jgi:hypothetical protein
MKIEGQSYLDHGERFFHGMYVVAQGNPFYDGNPADGVVSLGSIFGPFAMTLVIALIVAAMMVGFYIYHTRRTTPIVTTLPGM